MRSSGFSAPTARARPRRSRSWRATGNAPAATCRCSASIPRRPTRRVARPARSRVAVVRARSAADGARDAVVVRRLLLASAAGRRSHRARRSGRQARRRAIGRLSGGQRRRADVGVALIGDPELVFLDEPTTGFDPAARREAWSMIEGLKALGKTVFLTTHYMDEAQHLADRVAILRAGRIVALGRPDELGEGLRAETIVTLPRARPAGPARLCGARGRRRRRRSSATRSTIRTADPQALLGRLLALGRRAPASPGASRGPSTRPRGRLPRAGRR